MIDIHSHILPGVDDGAADLFDALEMIHQAQFSGIRAMIATPHCNIPGSYENYLNEEYKERVRALQEAVRAEGLGVEILPGAEAFATSELPQLIKDGKIMTLNGSRYLLMEFAFQEDPEYAFRLTEEVRETGVIPVIAHAERYTFVQENPNIVYEWRMLGFPIQINKGSIRGKFGSKAKAAAYTLLDHRLVSVIASDAHGPFRRTPKMEAAYEQLLGDYSESYLRMLFMDNPGRICRNEPILGLKAKMVE